MPNPLSGNAVHPESIHKEDKNNKVNTEQKKGRTTPI